MRKFSVSIILILMSCYAVAQPKSFNPQKRTSYVPSVNKENLFREHWDLAVGLTGTSFYSNQENGEVSGGLMGSKRSKFGLSASAAYWWSKSFALRTKVSGLWGKSYHPEFNVMDDNRYFGVREEFMVDVPNIVIGYDKGRVWDVSPYVGIGFSRNFTDNKNAFGGSFGVNASLKLNNSLKWFLDCSYYVSFGDMDNISVSEYRKNFGKHDRVVSLETGIAVSLGKGRKTPRAAVNGVSWIYEGSLNKDELDLSYVRGIGNKSRKEPLPEGMVLVRRGHLHMGGIEKDSVWGGYIPTKDISVKDFWMDEKEVTNAKYRQFVMDVRDSIFKSRLASFGGDSVKAMATLYRTNNVTGEKFLDGSQLYYKYEKYDFLESAKEKYKDARGKITIYKDTAYFDKDGKPVIYTIERKHTGDWDFLNTYIVNVYPDTTCWVNDFPNSDNVEYMRYYFSDGAYNDYPVVGVSWRQAEAYCAWRTALLRKKVGFDVPPYRLPTEAEWEFAARGRGQHTFPWGDSNPLKFANFMPDIGNFTEDENLITCRVGCYQPNSNGLYDMAGNVAEWTSSVYTETGVDNMSNINPNLLYNASMSDDMTMRRKTVKGGSWKDPAMFVKSAWRTFEQEDKGRSYIGFRCVRSLSTAVW